MSEKVKLSAWFTAEEAAEVRKLARLVQFPKGISGVLRLGAAAMWGQYGPYADVLDKNREKLAEEARLARTSD